MVEHEVLIVGAGPAGMMLAAELALAGIDVGIIERRSDHELVGSRAGGLHARTLEVLDQRGVVDRFLVEGRPAQAIMVGTRVVDMSDFPTRHPYSLAIWQNQVERILAAWIAELGVLVHHGREVVGFSQDDRGVAVQMAGGALGRSRYLAGCDGGHSLIRKAAAIAFPGSAPTRSCLVAEVELTEDPPPGVRMDTRGAHGLHRMEDGETFRVVVTEQEVHGDGTEPGLRELSEALTAVFKTDFGVHSPAWISRFTDMTRQAATYRAGRVLLAGDAAHVQFPAGGQGLGLGLQDAANLGWKLAQAVRRDGRQALLDSYHAERHPVAARALRYSMALGALQRRGDRMDAVADLVSELTGLEAGRRHVAGVISGLDIRYDLGAGHPLLGRRMPDLDLDTVDGPIRLYRLLDPGRALLISVDGSAPPDTSGWGDRVRVTVARCEGPWQLPVLGEVTGPGAALVRPDGYVAWTADQGPLALQEALATWVGPPAGVR